MKNLILISLALITLIACEEREELVEEILMDERVEIVEEITGIENPTIDTLSQVDPTTLNTLRSYEDIVGVYDLVDITNPTILCDSYDNISLSFLENEQYRFHNKNEKCEDVVFFGDVRGDITGNFGLFANNDNVLLNTDDVRENTSSWAFDLLSFNGELLVLKNNASDLAKDQEVEIFTFIRVD